MIQRKQTIYLLLIICITGSLLMGNPLMYEVSGENEWTKGQIGLIEVSILKIDVMLDEVSKFQTWNSYLIYSLSIVGFLASLSIFLFRNRKLQLLLCGFNYLAMAISGVLMYIYIIEGQTRVYQAESSGLHYLFLLSLLLPVWNFLAMRGILKDEKLIRSVNRLR